MFNNDIEKQTFIRQLTQFDDNGEAQANCGLRSFSLSREDDGRYYPFEMIPTGALYDPDKKGPSHARFSHAHSETLRADFMASPNTFAEVCKDMKLNVDHLCRSGGGYGIGTRYFESQTDAVNAVLEAIATNQPYQNMLATERSAAEQRQAAIEAERDRIAYFEQIALPESDTLLSDKTNFMGGALKQEQRDAILTYLNSPSLSQWQTISSIGITPSFTLWQALWDFDPSTPRNGNAFTEQTIPSADKLERVLVSAVARHNARCADRIKQAKAKLTQLGAPLLASVDVKKEG